MSGQETETIKNKEFFDTEEWRKTADNVDYTETFKERKKKDKEKKERKEREFSRKTRKPLAIGLFVKVLLIVFIVGVLAVLIYYLLRNTFKVFSERVPDTKLEEIVENLEDNIHNADFEALIQQAIGSGQYKLAVRIFYLHIIKALSDKELIKWKKNKTNGHYVREMLQNALGQKFSFLTVVYEQVWFGQKTIDQNNYNIISKEFTKFITQLD